jgi:hypothetical protein
MNSSIEGSEFPPAALVGSLGELSHLLASGTEVPPEFYFVSALTLLGATCSTNLKLNIGIDFDTRLYTVLLGGSYEVKKSTAMRRTIAFFQTLWPSGKPEVIYGTGSGEGLARKLTGSPDLILACDELRALVDKTRVQSSSLLPMVTSLFEGNHWDNATKHTEQSFSVRNAHLSLLGCCTTETYARMWSGDAIAIGFANRLFIVGADRKCRVAWPQAPNQADVDRMASRVSEQLARLPLTLEIQDAAKEAWGEWYLSLPASEHSKRLDTIGFRLLALIALITDKEQVDVETVQTVRSILEYELNIRRLTDPIDADTMLARMEEKIRRVLRVKGSLSRRDLRRHTHADRDGIWAFNSALTFLLRETDISATDGIFSLVET